MRKFLAILVLSLVVVISPYLAWAQSYDQVSQIAKDITVLIDGCSAGSGVIYERTDNLYSVLTANHVVQTPRSCLIITPDGVRHRTQGQKWVPVAGVDLAVLQFSSATGYKLAEFGSSEQVRAGKTVYVSGSPEPSQAIPQRTLLVTEGNIVGVQEPQNGYTLIYDNSTRRGMSGGAVLDENGRVIGIHGQGDEQDGNKVGLNLGIPIQVFLDAPKPEPKPSPTVSPSPSPVASPSPSPSPTVSPSPSPVPSPNPTSTTSTTESSQSSPSQKSTNSQLETCNYWLGRADTSRYPARVNKFSIMPISLLVSGLCFSLFLRWMIKRVKEGFSWKELLFSDSDMASKVGTLFATCFSSFFVTFSLLYWLIYVFIANQYCRPFGYSWAM